MDPTLSEIRIFAGNFAPLSWAFCNGALLSIAENTALFSLIGTTYGGDGQVTFALPDLRGRVPVGTGQGAGLSYWDLGEVEGTETVTLIQSQLAAHTHTANGVATPSANVSGAGAASTPGNGFFSISSSEIYSTPHNQVGGATPFTINLGITGSNQPHENMMPYLAMNYIIAVEGIYPSRN